MRKTANSYGLRARGEGKNPSKSINRRRIVVTKPKIQVRHPFIAFDY